MEKHWARAIARLGTSQRRKLLKLLGDPPKLENLPPEFWDGHFNEWRGLLTPELERVFVDSATLMLEAQPAIGVDWALVNQDAADWARRYGAELVRGIDETTRRGVRDAVSDFYEEGLNMGQLREKIGRWYSPQRAFTIATTEVTRASVEGERAVVKELAADGIEMVEVWQTNNDELVCPICGPRHGQPKGSNWTEADGPPAHPNCRCWITHEFAEAS